MVDGDLDFTDALVRQIFPISGGLNEVGGSTYFKFFALVNAAHGLAHSLDFMIDSVLQVLGGVASSVNVQGVVIHIVKAAKSFIFGSEYFEWGHGSVHLF